MNGTFIFESRLKVYPLLAISRLSVTLIFIYFIFDPTEMCAKCVEDSVVPVHAMRTHGGDCHFYSPADLSPEKEPSVSIPWNAGLSHSDLGALLETEISRHCRESNADWSVCHPVAFTVPVMQSKLLQ